MKDLATLCSNTGRYRTARRLLIEVLDRSARRNDMGQEVRADTERRIGYVMQEMRRAKGARQFLESALTYYDRPEVTDIHGLFYTLRDLAQTTRDLGDLDVAISLQKRVVEITCAICGGADLQTARARSDLARLLRMRGDFRSARDLNLESLSLAKTNGVDPGQVLGITQHLIIDYMGLESWREAVTCARNVLAIAEQLPPDRPEARWVRRTGRCAQAALAFGDKEKMNSKELKLVKVGLRAVATRSTVTGPAPTWTGVGSWWVRVKYWLKSNRDVIW